MNQTITMVPQTNPVQIDKRVLIKFSGGMRQSQEIFIGPGTTTRDILEHLGLERNNFIVSMGTPDTVFGKDENIYPIIQDGDQLFVSSKVDAGRN